MTKKFKSIGSKIRYYIREILEDGEEHTFTDIRDYISNYATKQEIKTLPGVLDRLVRTSGDYDKLRRGVYVKVNFDKDRKYNDKINIEIQKHLMKARKEIEGQLSEFDDVDIYSLSKKDLEDASKIKNVRDKLTMIGNHLEY